MGRIIKKGAEPQSATSKLPQKARCVTDLTGKTVVVL